MAKIVPAILTSNKDQLDRELEIVKKISDRFQLDVIDEHFVDNRTLFPDEIDGIGNLLIDIHLMVTKPDEYIISSTKLKPNLIIIQYEIDKNIEPYLKKIKNFNIKTGIAINPETQIGDISHFFELIDHLLVMAYPAGFAGQEFQPKNLGKALQARVIKPDLEIGLDGGASLENVKVIAKADFDVINVNSAIFKANDPVEAYQQLSEAIR
ncbi:MAG: hypothetical protein Q8P54_01670 [bacterium]|nr:hypothetical protein [bacterium]